MKILSWNFWVQTSIEVQVYTGNSFWLIFNFDRGDRRYPSELISKSSYQELIPRAHTKSSYKELIPKADNKCYHLEIAHQTRSKETILLFDITGKKTLFSIIIVHYRSASMIVDNVWNLNFVSSSNHNVIQIFSSFNKNYEFRSSKST